MILSSHQHPRIPAALRLLLGGFLAGIAFVHAAHYLVPPVEAQAAERGSVLTRYPDGTTEAKQYDEEGELAAETDRQGRTLRYTRDALKRLTVTTDAFGSSSNAYDAAGRLVAQTDALGRRTEHQYDAAGRRIATTDALGQTTTYGYDDADNLTAVTDPLGRATRYQYDALKRLIGTTFSDGGTATREYDAAGRLVAQTDPRGSSTRYAYDALNRLAEVTDALGGRTTYGYDEAGRRTAQTDALGRVTRWAYDAAGRLSSRTLPLGQTEDFYYDPRGNLIALRRGGSSSGGDSVSREFDAGNRLSAKHYPDGRSWRYRYQGEELVEVSTEGGASGAMLRTLDVLRVIAEREDNFRYTLSHSYNAAGQRSALTSGASAETPRSSAYTYDAAGRLQTVTDAQGGLTTYTYDAAGQISAIALPDGSRLDYAYDLAGRVLSQSHSRQADGSLLARYTYSYGPGGERLTARETTPSTVRGSAYSYDALGRLTAEEVDEQGQVTRRVEYRYDAVGNRLEKTETLTGPPTETRRTVYSYDGNDRLVSETTTGGATSRQVNYRWDEAGRLVVKEALLGADSLQEHFAYNPEDQLEVYTRQSASEHLIKRYRYDGLGHRIGESTENKLTGTSTSTRYLLDRVAPYAQVIEERDGNGARAVHYALAYPPLGSGVQRLSEWRGTPDAAHPATPSGAATSYYHARELASTAFLTDTTGQVTDRYAYDAFGTTLAHTGTNPTRFQFTGEAVDAVSGLVHLRARQMDPGVGRFVSRDPWEGDPFRPGALHAYAYAENAPAWKFDPGGEMTINDALQAVNRMGQAVTRDSARVFEYANTAGRKGANATTKIACHIGYAFVEGMDKNDHHPMQKSVYAVDDEGLFAVLKQTHDFFHFVQNMLFKDAGLSSPSNTKAGKWIEIFAEDPQLRKVAIAQTVKAAKVVDRICEFKPPKTFQKAVADRLKRYLKTNPLR